MGTIMARVHKCSGAVQTLLCMLLEFFIVVFLYVYIPCQLYFTFQYMARAKAL
jgi:hypothetical protein